jgi:hypothetical protein
MMSETASAHDHSQPNAPVYSRGGDVAVVSLHGAVVGLQVAAYQIATLPLRYRSRHWS